MTALDMFRDLLLQVFTKEVCIALILVTLFLLFMSLVAGGSDDSGSSLKPKGNDEKKISTPPKEPLPEIIGMWREEDSISYSSVTLPVLRCSVDFTEGTDTIEITLPKEYPFKAGTLTAFLNDIPDTLVEVGYPGPGLSKIVIQKLPHISWIDVRSKILTSLFKNWEMPYIK